jgi:hypothetical protein
MLAMVPLKIVNAVAPKPGHSSATVATSGEIRSAVQFRDTPGLHRVPASQPPREVGEFRLHGAGGIQMETGLNVPLRRAR